jgi:glycosyltransferase involved in cell wall biosynthesis
MGNSAVEELAVKAIDPQPVSGGGVPHISVCICTFKRPALLATLLKGIFEQRTDGEFTFSVVVVDNDRLGSARETVERFGTERIKYDIEPEQNIALARNRAMRNASGDFVACIDDDECPEREWLLTLYKACVRYKAAGVLGPVKPAFEKEPPKWVVKGKFYDRPTHETGFVIPWTEGRTGNVLFRRSILNGVAPVFRAEFKSGGEDRNFFMRMIEAGHVFIWCDEAVAYETVPAVRCTRSFMLRRALLRGKMSLNHRTIGLKGVLISAAVVPIYSMTLPFLLLSGQHRFMLFLIKICDHGGRILAFMGINPVRESYVVE